MEGRLARAAIEEGGDFRKPHLKVVEPAIEAPAGAGKRRLELQPVDALLTRMVVVHERLVPARRFMRREQRVEAVVIVGVRFVPKEHEASEVIECPRLIEV